MIYKKKASEILYPKKLGSDQTISIYGAMMMYRKLLRENKIKANGSAARRLAELEKRYDSGEKYYRS